MPCYMLVDGPSMVEVADPVPIRDWGTYEDALGSVGYEPAVLPAIGADAATGVTVYCSRTADVPMFYIDVMGVAEQIACFVAEDVPGLLKTLAALGPLTALMDGKVAGPGRGDAAPASPAGRQARDTLRRRHPAVCASRAYGHGLRMLAARTQQERAHPPAFLAAATFPERPTEVHVRAGTLTVEMETARRLREEALRLRRRLEEATQAVRDAMETGRTTAAPAVPASWAREDEPVRQHGGHDAAVGARVRMAHER